MSPRIAVVNNIALDHKSMEELRALFAGFVAKAEIAVLNLDNEETAALVLSAKVRTRTYQPALGAGRPARAQAIRPAPDGDCVQRAASATAAPAPTCASTCPASTTSPTRSRRSRRRARMGCRLTKPPPRLRALPEPSGGLEIVGKASGVTVIDDFAHNPDKIAATLKTLHAFPGRLLIMFQPHGFGPLKLMRDEFIDCFAEHMAADDVLIMPDPVYFGGTVDRAVTSEHIVAGVRARGLQAMAFAERAACGDKLIELAEPGDRIVGHGRARRYAECVRGGIAGAAGEMSTNPDRRLPASTCTIPG